MESSYDGRTKHWTKDCEGCRCRQESFCYWGVAVKRLSRGGTVIGDYYPNLAIKQRHCEFRSKESVRAMRGMPMPGDKEFVPYDPKRKKALVQSGPGAQARLF